MYHGENIIVTLYFITKLNKKQVASNERSLQVLQMRFSSKICGSDQSQQNKNHPSYRVILFTAKNCLFTNNHQAVAMNNQLLKS